MTVAKKLAVAFALHILILSALLIHHVRTIRESVSISYELTDISSRTYSTATEQVRRVVQMEENAAKHWVTRDSGYLNRFDELFAEYGGELASLSAQPLSEPERARLTALEAGWKSFGDLARSLGSLRESPDSQESLALIQVGLDSLRTQTQRLGHASQESMLLQLQRASLAAHRTERLSWMAAAGALVLSVLISALIVRSITESLSRLAHGTREVARGRFGYRLNTGRDDEFAQVARDFNTMSARLHELDRMKQDFISKVSHDLKTPLASMQETIDVLLDEVPGPLGAKQRRLLELNHESGRRLYSMIGKLLDLSRLEAGVIEPSVDMIDLGQLITEVAEAHARRGTDLSTAVPDEPVVLECDLDRIQRLLDNLVENALKFATRGEVGIAMHLHDARPADVPLEHWSAVARRRDLGGVAHIIVSDDGPGVPDAHKLRIFERFFQGEAGRAVSSRGVGLGLTICREIANIHAGAIWVADRAAGGSEFHVLLPGALRVPLAPASLRPIPEHEYLPS
jgi:signal transduction histidine kinase